MANSNGWGDGAANNAIGWGQGANNAIGWGDIHADSWAGATDIVGVAAFTGILDTYSGASAAYSVRRLSSTYTGNLIRVRRSSDNTEQDIGYDSNNVLDETALITFVGANNGFVTTWYDQSGNGNNIIQTTAVNQPIIISSGVLQTEGTKPAMYFDGINDNLANASVPLNTYISLYLVSKTTTSKPLLIEHSPNTNNGNGFFIYGSSNSSWFFARSGVTNYAEGTSNWAGSTRILSTFIYNSTIRNYYKNSIIQANNLVGGVLLANTSLSTSLNIFSRNGSLFFSDGNIQELIIYNDISGNNKSGIESNVNSFYSIY
jgi:hypothetical protein